MKYIMQKGNQQRTVDTEISKNRLLQDGFDLVDAKGNVVEASAKKNVPFIEYQKLLDENEKLKGGKGNANKGGKGEEDKGGEGA